MRGAGRDLVSPDCVLDDVVGFFPGSGELPIGVALHVEQEVRRCRGPNEPPCNMSAVTWHPLFTASL